MTEQGDTTRVDDELVPGAVEVRFGEGTTTEQLLAHLDGLREALARELEDDVQGYRYGWPPLPKDTPGMGYWVYIALNTQTNQRMQTGRQLAPPWKLLGICRVP